MTDSTAMATTEGAADASARASFGAMVRLLVGSGVAVVSALLACGMVASLLYVATDVLASQRWVGYRYADRSVSELLAVGAPTRSFVVGPMVAYNVLMVAFGVGVWLAARRRRSLKIAAGVLVVYGVTSMLGLLAFPLRQDSALRASGAMPLSGILHVSATFALVLLIFTFIGFGSVVRGWGFRLYSMATIAVMFLGGALAGSQVNRAAAGLPTPGLGLLERANIYSSLLWVALFAWALMTTLHSAAEDSALSD